MRPQRRAVQTPRLPVYGLAEYISSNQYNQMRALEYYKYPEVGFPRAIYYAPARDAIRAFHRSGEDSTVLTGELFDLEVEAHLATTDYERTRLSHNARAIRAYVEHRGNRHYEVRPLQRTALSIEGVEINANPDLHVAERGTVKLLKLEFAEEAPDDEFARIVAECLFRGAREAGIEVAARHTCFYHIESDREWRGTEGRRRWQNIEAACRQIAALWANV